MKRITSFVVLASIATTAHLSAQTPKTDAQGDSLPPGAVARLGTLRWRAGSQVVLASYQIDGKALIAIAQDFTAHVWDADNGKEVRHFDVSGGGTASVNPALGGRAAFSVGNNGAAISGDGKTLACTGRDGMLRIFDATTGKETRTLSIVTTGGLNRVALSPDGKSVAVSGYTQPIRVYDTATGKQLRTFGPLDDEQLRSFTYRLEYGSDGKTLFVGGLEYNRGPQTAFMCIWNAETGKIVKRMDKLINNVAWTIVLQAAVAPDHKTVAVPVGAEIVVYDVTSGEIARKIKYNAESHTTVLFSHDSKSLFALTGKGDALAVWDRATGNLIRQCGTPPDATAAGANVAVALKLVSGTTVSPDGKTIAMADGPAIALLDTITGKPRHAEFGHTASLKEASFAKDGKTIVTRGGDGSVLRWDAETAKSLGAFTIPNAKATYAFVLPSPDGKLAAAGEPSGIVHVFDAATGKELHTISADVYGMSVGFSPDSKMLAVASRGASVVQLHDAATGTKLFDLTLPPPQNAFDPRFNAFAARFPNRRLIFSADSRMVGVASEGFLTFWDTATGVKVRVLPLPDGKILRHAAISPNGVLAAVEYTDGETTLYEIATATSRAVLTAGTPAVPGNPNAMLVRIMNNPNEFPLSLAFSSDGRMLARAGEDGKIRLWDVRAIKEIGAFEGHRGALVSAAFSPNGSQLVTASADTTALIWDVAPLRTHLASAAAPAASDRVESLWTALGGTDAAAAHAAIQALEAAPVQAVALFKNRVKPTELPDPKHVASLVGDLSDVKFSVREKARKELERLGDLAVPALRDALQNGAGPQTRRQTGKLLEALDNRAWTPEQVRLSRVVEVLETVATPDAVEILKSLATGAPAAIPTPQAKAALERLK